MSFLTLRVLTRERKKSPCERCGLNFGETQRQSRAMLNHQTSRHDRDAKFGEAVDEAVSTIGLSAAQTSFCSPWQDGIAERWVGSCRQGLLDHIIPLNEHHLRRLLSEYIRYYHEDRTHLGLEKDTPNHRSVPSPSPESKVISFSRLGGLHHRYDVAA